MQYHDSESSSSTTTSTQASSNSGYFRHGNSTGSTIAGYQPENQPGSLRVANTVGPVTSSSVPIHNEDGATVSDHDSSHSLCTGVFNHAWAGHHDSQRNTPSHALAVTPVTLSYFYCSSSTTQERVLLAAEGPASASVAVVNSVHAMTVKFGPVKYFEDQWNVPQGDSGTGGREETGKKEGGKR
eukprot:2048469-Rhodomonas_salina.1